MHTAGGCPDVFVFWYLLFSTTPRVGLVLDDDATAVSSWTKSGARTLKIELVYLYFEVHALCRQYYCCYTKDLTERQGHLPGARRNGTNTHTPMCLHITLITFYLQLRFSRFVDFILALGRQSVKSLIT